MTEDKLQISMDGLIELYEADDTNKKTFGEWWEANKDQYVLDADEFLPRECPRCDKLITTLKLWEPTQLKKDPSIELDNGIPRVEWTWKDQAEITELDCEFECPLCDEMLFTSWEDADLWLMDPTGKAQPQEYSYKSYAAVSVAIDDIMGNFEDHAHLQEAAKYLEGWMVQRIASKIGDALLEGGCYRTGIEIWAKDYLENAYNENRDKIHQALQCTLCRLNPNDTQPPEQQIDEMQFIKEEGMCSACQNEHAEAIHGKMPKEEKP